MKSRYLWGWGFALAIPFFGLSLTIRQEAPSHGLAIPLDLKGVEAAIQSMQTGHLHINTGPRNHIVLAGQQSLSAAEQHWGFVRQSALWANNNSNLADQIIMALKRAGLLNQSGTHTTTITINGVNYKFKLEVGTCGNCNGITATAYSGTKNFTNRLKLWRASDNKDALELLFNDVNNLSGNPSGILLTYRLGVLNSTFSNNENLIVESYITGASPSRKQTYSWGAEFWLAPDPRAGNTSDRGRVVIEERTIGIKNQAPDDAGICVRIASRTVSFTSACGTGQHYYALAYGQKTGGNLETTARSGLAVGDLNTGGNICGVNLLKYGIFNANGFIQDGLDAASIPDGFPDPNAHGGYPGVTALFNLIDKNGRSDTNDSFDDLRKYKIDGLNVINFHPINENPGF
jgi:hypothetical protein